jgi:hypothetical protein
VVFLILGIAWIWYGMFVLSHRVGSLVAVAAPVGVAVLLRRAGPGGVGYPLLGAVAADARTTGALRLVRLVVYNRHRTARRVRSSIQSPPPTEAAFSTRM